MNDYRLFSNAVNLQEFRLVSRKFLRTCGVSCGSTFHVKLYHCPKLTALSKLKVSEQDYEQLACRSERAACLSASLRASLVLTRLSSVDAGARRPLVRRARRGRLEAWSGIDDDAGAMVPDGGPNKSMP